MCIRFNAIAAYVALDDGFHVEKGNQFVYTNEGIYASRHSPSDVGLTVDETLQPDMWPINDDGSLTLFRDYWVFVCANDDESPHAAYLRAAIAAANTDDNDVLRRVRP